MINRYGDHYQFEKLTENSFQIVGDLNYWRFGGKDGQDIIDFNDLGYVDPSGGPFIAVGSMLEGRVVARIRVEATDFDNPDRIIFEVK